jgi:NitT/TauT family transport system ATP-binding protein
MVTRSVSKRYESRSNKTVHAIDNLDFAMQEGEFVSIVGPSGCGKSTLLKILAGLIPPSSGSVLFYGSEMVEPSRRVGVMFQRPTLFAWRSVLENVLLPIEIIGDRSADWPERARLLLAKVGLQGFENSYPRELSGGMQQRVALSRVLLYRPQVLLLDEPFGALDEMTRESLNMDLQELCLSEGVTVLLVTHHIGEAVLLSDRVLVMSHAPGRIKADLEIDLPRPRDAATMRSSAYADRTFAVREALGISK